MELAKYYRDFIKDFALISLPLVILTIKNVTWRWGSEQQQAFERLKSELISYPILRPPYFSKQFILQTDASGYALGVVLSQIDENGEYVVAYV